MAKPFRYMTVAFKLANFEVGLVKMTQNGGVPGKWLCPEHVRPVKYTYRCGEGTDEEHELDTRPPTGYEFDGSFVLPTEEQFASIMPEKDATLAVRKVCRASEIDFMWFGDSRYALVPRPGTPKATQQAYNLLANELKKGKLAALGTCVLWGGEKPWAVMWSNFTNSLVLQELVFAGEMRFDELPSIGESAAPSVKGMGKAYTDMAATLVGELRDEFDPHEFRDEYTPALLEMLARAKKGEKVPTKPEPRTDGNAGDVLDALRQSVKAVSKNAKKNGASTKKKKAGV